MEALLSAKRKWNCCCFFCTMLYSNKTETSLFLAVLSLRCCMGFSLVAETRGTL